jgi:hypothetical protein
MRLRSTDISARTIGDETIVLSLTASRYFTITGVGVRVFQLLAEDISLDELVGFTEHTRELARRWDGDGVDTALVDPEALRNNWLSASPHAPSMALLQQAWLATQRPQRGARP